MAERTPPPPTDDQLEKQVGKKSACWEYICIYKPDRSWCFCTQCKKFMKNAGNTSNLNLHLTTCKKRKRGNDLGPIQVALNKGNNF